MRIILLYIMILIMRGEIILDLISVHLSTSTANKSYSSEAHLLSHVLIHFNNYVAMAIDASFFFKLTLFDKFQDAKRAFKQATFSIIN